MFSLPIPLIETLTKHSDDPRLASNRPVATHSGSGHPVTATTTTSASPGSGATQRRCTVMTSAATTSTTAGSVTLPFDALQQFALPQLDPDQDVQHGDDRHRADEKQEAGHLEGVCEVMVFELWTKPRAEIEFH